MNAPLLVMQPLKMDVLNEETETILTMYVRSQRVAAIQETIKEWSVQDQIAALRATLMVVLNHNEAKENDNGPYRTW